MHEYHISKLNFCQPFSAFVYNYFKLRCEKKCDIIRKTRKSRRFYGAAVSFYEDPQKKHAPRRGKEPP